MCIWWTINIRIDSVCSPHHCGVFVFLLASRPSPVRRAFPSAAPLSSTHFTHNSSHTQLISHTTHLTHRHQKTYLTQLISHNSSYTQLISHTTHLTNHLISHITHLTQLISHHSSHTTHLTPPHLTPLIHTTHLTPLISYQTHVKPNDTKLHMWGYPVLLLFFVEQFLGLLLGFFPNTSSFCKLLHSICSICLGLQPFPFFRGCHCPCLFCWLCFLSLILKSIILDGLCNIFEMLEAGATIQI